MEYDLSIIVARGFLRAVHRSVLVRR